VVRLVLVAVVAVVGVLQLRLILASVGVLEITVQLLAAAVGLAVL
jgi:hypothetical protein